MAQQREVEYTIVKGPYRQIFLEAFADAYPYYDGMKKCQFELQDENHVPSTAYVRLRNIQHSDESSNRFDFSGILSKTVFDGDTPVLNDSKLCSGHYDTCRQEGWVKIIT